MTEAVGPNAGRPLRPADIDDRALARLERMIDRTGSCWLWTGSRGAGGYGRFHLNGLGWYAHRVAYVALGGHGLGPREVLDHLCREHACVRPDHLESVTQRVNVQRGVGHSVVNALKTSCPQGHPYDAANTRVERTTGRRRCIICSRATKRRWVDRQRERSTTI